MQLAWVYYAAGAKTASLDTTSVSTCGTKAITLGFDKSVVDIESIELFPFKLK